MKKILASLLISLTAIQAFAQNEPITSNKSNTAASLTIEPLSQILLPILFITFLVFMLTALIKYFLEFRLKNKLIDKGMSEQLSAYLLNKNGQEKKNEAIKLAILFCGIGTGLAMTYLTAPINIHSLSIIALSIGLSYLAYFFYLQKQST